MGDANKEDNIRVRCSRRFKRTVRLFAKANDTDMSEIMREAAIEYMLKRSEDASKLAQIEKGLGGNMSIGIEGDAKIGKISQSKSRD